MDVGRHHQPPAEPRWTETNAASPPSPFFLFFCVIVLLTLSHSLFLSTWPVVFLQTDLSCAKKATQLTTNWCSIKEPGKLDQHFYMCRVLIVSINDLTELLHANVFITVTNCEPKPFYSEKNKRLFCTSSSESSYIIAFGMPEAAFSSHIFLFMGNWNLYVDI